MNTAKNVTRHSNYFFHNLAALVAGNIFTFSLFWLIQINLSWLAYQLTNSSFLLGFLGFMVNVPMLFLIVAGGVFSDKFHRKLIMLICQASYLLPNLTLFTMVYTHHITYWSMISVGLLYGGLFGFAKPSVDASVFDISNNESQLKIGVSLNSSTSQIALLFTPLLSKWVIALFGFPSVFILGMLLNVLAFSVFSLLKIPKKSKLPEVSGLQFFQSVKLALVYIKENKILSIFIILVSLALGLIISLQFQFPAIIKTFATGTKNTLYHFYIFSALGALTGAIFILIRHYTSKTSLHILTISLLLQALTIISLSFATSLFMCYFLVFFIAAFGMIASIIGTITIQRTVENEKRGRVLSLLEMSRIGAIPIMSFILGVATALLGIFSGLMIFGILYFVGVLSFKIYISSKTKFLLN